MQSITYYLKEPRAIGRSVLRYCSGLLPDKLYVEWMYFMQTGKRLNLKAAQAKSNDGFEKILSQLLAGDG